MFQTFSPRSWPARSRPRPLASTLRPRRALVALACAAGLASLSGCAGWPAKAPAAAAPVAPVSRAWQQPLPAGPVITTARWWTALGDATLDGLVAEALTRAPDARTAALRLREARARRDATAAAAAPDLSGSARASRSRSSGAAGSGRSSSLFDAGFDASWEADVWGRLAAATEGADADVAAVAAGVQDVQLTLAAEVARLYTSLRAVQQREALAAQALQRQADTLQITRWRAQAGLVAQTDVLQAETSLAQTVAQQAQLVASRASALLQLEGLLGRPPGDLTAALAAPAVGAAAATSGGSPATAAGGAGVPSGDQSLLPALPAGGAVAQPADVLRQRPDVRQAEAQWRAESARTRQAEAAQFPRLTLSGSLGLQALTLGTLGQGGTGSLAAGLAAPLVDGGALRAQLAAQVAVRDRAALAYEQAMRTALSEVEDALAALDASRRQASALQQALAAAGQTAELARVRYRSGLVDARTVIDAERSVLSLADSLASARAAALGAWIQWHKALGVGAVAVDPAPPAAAPTLAGPSS